jgi:hypothetical protein
LTEPIASLPQTPKRTAASEANPAQVLLGHLIDYAGLFPPAGLNMQEAVTNYDAYLDSEYSWMLGRFIVPVARLNEFGEAKAQLPGTSKPWPLSALLGTDPTADLAPIAAFNTNQAHTVIESVEVKAETPDDVKRVATAIPRELTTFFEIPLTGRERECIAAIGECGRSAKIRTGGETADKFPDPARIVEFLKLCADNGVPFKATAGLHHPLRSIHRLTYQADSASALMHGFLNVFLAAAFLQAGMNRQSAIELLEEKSLEAIRFDTEGVMWREHRLSASEIAVARQGLAISFGSCSFQEPVDDLQSLGLL